MVFILVFMQVHSKGLSVCDQHYLPIQIPPDSLRAETFLIL